MDVTIKNNYRELILSKLYFSQGFRAAEPTLPWESHIDHTVESGSRTGQEGSFSAVVLKNEPQHVHSRQTTYRCISTLLPSPLATHPASGEQEENGHAG